MKIFWIIWLLLQILSFSTTKLNEQFLKNLIFHHTFYSPKYNIIICGEHGNLNLIKMFSERFQGFLAIRSPDEAFNSLVDEPQAFLLDLQCPKAFLVLNQAKDLNKFSHPYQWLLLNEVLTYSTQNTSSENDTDWFWPLLETLNILIDSNVRVIEGNSEQKITVTGVYKLDQSLIKEHLLEWSSSEGIIFFNSKTVVARRWNLQGVTLPSSIVMFDPNSINNFQELLNKHIDTTSKVSLNMVNFFGDLFNASMKYTIRKEWGVLINGSWTGMVGDLQRKEIEVTASPLFFLAGRLHFLEHFASVTPTRMKFIFLSPPLSYSSNIFAMPFDTIVWSCCFGMVAVSCFLLFTALNYEKSYFETEEEKFKNKKSKVSFSEILVLNIGAICLQGMVACTAAQTKDPPGRIITLFLYMSYLFLYISYSASIVAILQSSDTSIQTLSDFLKSPLKAGAEDVAYSRYYFQKAEDEVRKAIYHTKIAPVKESPNFLPIEEGIKKVRKGFYGYHVEVSLGYQVIQKTFTEEEKCALQELRDSFFQFPDPWVTMRKKSPYAELFKIGMKMAVERGFKSRFVRRFYTEKPICSSKTARFVSVGIFDCYYAFILLSSGLFAAMMILLTEISFKKFLKRRVKPPASNDDLAPNFEFLN